MTDIRKFIYKINLKMDDGSLPPITVATADKNKLPQLIESNRVWFERSGKKMVGWKFSGEINPFGLTQEKYEEELSFVDVLDDVEDAL